MITDILYASFSATLRELTHLKFLHVEMCHFFGQFCSDRIFIFHFFEKPVYSNADPSGGKKWKTASGKQLLAFAICFYWQRILHDTKEKQRISKFEKGLFATIKILLLCIAIYFCKMSGFT